MIGVGIKISHCLFENNSAISGGAISIVNNKVSFSAISFSAFIANEAEIDGGAIYCSNGGSTILESVYSYSNSAMKGCGGFGYLSNCHLGIEGNLSRNVAMYGGAIYSMDRSRITLSSMTTVVGNSAMRDGGAMYMSNSLLYLLSTPNKIAAVFDHNVARGKGGAIFALDKDCESLPYPVQCFLRINNFQDRLTFSNNTAAEGPVLYGGVLDRCFSDFEFQGDTLGICSVKNNSHYEQTPLAITSDPIRVCLCTQDGKIVCSIREMDLERMRGEAVHLMGVTVDQDENPKVGHIRAEFVETDAQLEKGEVRIRTGTNCTNLTFHIFTHSLSLTTLKLQPAGFCERSQFSSVAISIRVLNCSRGLERSGDRCICERRLREFFTDIVCDISRNSVVKSGSI